MLHFSSKYEKFWKWFQENEDEIYYFEANQDRVFDKLASRVSRIHKELVFEFSSIRDGRREFTLSAAGMRNAFPE